MNRICGLSLVVALASACPASENVWRFAPVDDICAYFESLRQADGAYAYPGQDVSHLSATYAAVMTYAALGRTVPSDRAALCRMIAGPLWPVAGERDAARTRWHTLTLHGFRLQQVRATKALGGDASPFRCEAEAWQGPEGYITGYEEGGNPMLDQQVDALLLKAEFGLSAGPKTQKAFTDYLDARERPDGSYNTTPAVDGSGGHIVNTAYALAGRRVLGAAAPDRKVVDWIRSCQRPDGGFTWAPNPTMSGVSDLWYAHAAVRALLDFGAKPKDEAAFLRWLGSLRNADGGFAPRPGLRSDPLATWRAVDLLVRLGGLPKLPEPPKPSKPSKPLDLSSLHAWTIQFEAPGSGSVREAVKVAKDLKIHLWGAKNAQKGWIDAAQAEADRRGVPVTFFASNENYGERRNLPGLGNFSHLRDPAYPPKGAADARPFELWQICDHECCARIWLDSGRYDAIGTFHFGCFDMSWILPFVYQYEETIPFVSNQDSHGETWWWRGELMAYRTVFLAKERTWDAFRDACAKGLVTSIREDVHTENRLRMLGGRPEAKARLRELEDEWRVRSLGNRVSVQLLTPEDVFETAHPKEGRLIRVRVDYKWRESRGILDPTCRLKSAELDERELAVDRKVFRHEKKDCMHNAIEAAYDLIALPEGCEGMVRLAFEPLPGTGGEPFTVRVSVSGEE